MAMRRIVCQFPNDTSFNDVLVHAFVCKNKVVKMYLSVFVILLSVGLHEIRIVI